MDQANDKDPSSGLSGLAHMGWAHGREVFRPTGSELRHNQTRQQHVLSALCSTLSFYCFGTILLEELHFVSIFPLFFSLLYNKNTLCTECLRMKWFLLKKKNKYPLLEKQLNWYFFYSFNILILKMKNTSIKHIV